MYVSKWIDLGLMSTWMHATLIIAHYYSEQEVEVY